YDGQIGAEATPQEFVDALIDCTREWMRVLKPTGSLWVNLGDKYSRGHRPVGGGPQVLGNPGGRVRDFQHQSVQIGVRDDAGGVPEKSLVGIPWRYAIRCIDDLGLILRAEVIWSK